MPSTTDRSNYGDRVRVTAHKARTRDLDLAELLKKEDLLLTDERRWQIMAEAIEAFAEHLNAANTKQIAAILSEREPSDIFSAKQMFVRYADKVARDLRAK